MWWDFKAADIAIILATALGPVLAVQAQKWIEGVGAIKGRRLTIFRTLMSTRATRLSAAHVEALNAVPVEFYGKKQRLKSILDDWHSYQDLLNRDDLDPKLLGEKRNDAFMDMLHKMSGFLGYDFSRSELQRDVYHPAGHVEVETDQIIIRRGFAQLMQGKLTIPMAVKEFPADPTAIQNQDDLRKLLVDWLEGKRSVKVDQK